MSRKETLEQFGSCWEGLEDPCNGNAGLHDFHELLLIALCCVLCGGQGAVDMALFAEAKEPFLRSFLVLANGLPSHDNFSRLFRNLDPDQFREQRLHRGVGCPACFQTGYLGRTGIYEIMVVGEELRDLIFQQIPKDVLRRVAVDLGMRTLKHSVGDKILEGTTTAEEAYRVVAF